MFPYMAIIAILLCASFARALNISFSVPFLVDQSPDGIPLSIPLTVAKNTSHVSIVKGIDCADLDSVKAQFVSAFNGSVHNPGLTFFKTANRPVWMTGLTPSPAIVCVDHNPIGFIDYYSPPTLSIPSGHPPYPKTYVQIRNFMNPGWVQEMPSVPCHNCDVFRNSFVFKEPIVNTVACSGHREESNYVSKFETTSGRPVDIFPFKKTIEHAGGTIGDILHSWTFSIDHIQLDRPDSEAKPPILGKPVYWCFYPDENADKGIYLGDAIFMLSENDTAALVFFLLYIGIGLPAICMITTALYCYKFKRHRKYLREVCHYIQTAQLEAEMQERNFMVIEAE